jgi:hypothetical protein
VQGRGPGAEIRADGFALSRRSCEEVKVKFERVEASPVRPFRCPNDRLGKSGGVERGDHAAPPRGLTRND